ncbi:MAG: NADH-quinone oxidoreductase subunit N, partial [Proteobacteria bacterium]|nr:NADH-quinone oxidoreductase subunit N [Pseudomonadota bacterium]
MTSTLVPAFGPFLAEMVLAIAALVLVLVGALRGDSSKGLIDWVAIIALILAGVLVLEQGPGTLKTFNGAFIADEFARFMKVLTLVGSLAAILLSSRFFKDENESRFEYTILILLSTLGMMVMISANEMISLYLGLELQSLALYVVAAINRDNVKSSEAGLKYFVLGALSSGMLLYGMSLVYGFTGTTSFEAIAASVH